MEGNEIADRIANWGRFGISNTGRHTMPIATHYIYDNIDRALRTTMPTIPDNISQEQDINELNKKINNALKEAATRTFETMPFRTNKPWISSTTIGYIAAARLARVNMDHEAETKAYKDIRKHVPKDKNNGSKTTLKKV